MRDLLRVALLSGAFALLTVFNVLWYESRARAVNAVPAPGGAIGATQTYQGAADTIKSYQTTFWVVEIGAFVVCVALAALPRRVTPPG